jgi:hypothetical protein
LTPSAVRGDLAGIVNNRRLWTPRRSRVWVLLAVAAAAITCDAPTAPRLGRIAVLPEFRAEHRGQFAGLTIDSVHIVVVRPPSTVVATYGARFSPDSAVLSADIAVTLQGNAEEFLVTLELVAAGQVVFSGTRPVTVTASAGNNLTPPPATPVAMDYVGPGANIASLTITPRDSGVTLGGTVPFAVTALDSGGGPLAQFYVSWSTSSSAHTIGAGGLFRAGNERGRVVVRARAHNGVRDSTAIFVVPVPTAVAVFAGGGQSGAAGARLAQPLVARVTAADAGPVAGVSVTFASTAGGGSVDTAAVVTDSLGRAGTTVVLGPGAGANIFTATVSGLPAASFAATATIADPTIVLSLADTIVGVGMSPNLTVQLLEPAPPGGLTVSVVSDSAAYLTVAAPGTIDFTAGQTQRTIQVTGVAPGVAVVRASAPGYNPDTLFAAIIPPFLSLPPTAGPNPGQSVQLVITAFPRPLGATAITVTSEDATVARVITPTVNLAAGQSSANATIEGVGPGTTLVTAVAAGYLQGATVVTTAGGGVPTTLEVAAGDGQTAYISDTLPQRPQLRVLDAAGAPVSGVTVAFAVTAGGGTITAPSAFTNAEGLAILGSAWRMGGTAGPNQLTASLPAFPGVTAVVINATATLPPPEIVLSVFGSNVVGQARSGVLNVRLLQAAPAGGLDVTVTSDSTQLLGIGAYGAAAAVVAFPAGDTLETVTVFGDSSRTGIAVVRATAEGYTPDTLLVPVSQNLISLPTTLNVPLSQSVSLPINLSVLAPIGGVVIDVTSDDPSVVVLTPQVVVPQGSQIINATVLGSAIGTAVVTATNPNYAPDDALVSVTADLNITAASITPNESFGLPITIQLLSGGSPVAAPAGGIPLEFISRDSSCAAAPPPGQIPQGLVSTTANVVYGGSATTPCSTRVVVTGPEGFGTDSVTVNMQPQPVATIATTFNIGSGLQRATSGSLGASNHGGTTVRVASSNPSVVTVSAAANIPGSAFVDIPVNIGTTTFSYVIHGMDGVVADTVPITASAPGFADGTALVRVWQAVYDIIFLNASGTTFTADDPFQVRTGTPASPTGNISVEDVVRAGSAGFAATVINDSSGVAILVDTAGSSDTSTVFIGAQQSRSPANVAAGGVALRYLAAGVTTVQAQIPAMRSIANSVQTVTVTSPVINPIGAMNLGSGLQRAHSFSLNAPAPAGGVAVTLALNRTGIALLAANATSVGSDTLVVNLAAGQTGGSFTVQALEGVIADTIQIVASAPGLVGSSGALRVWQSVFDIIFLNSTGTTLTADDAFQVRVGTPSSPTGTISVEDVLRFGSPGVTATVINDSTGVAILVDTTGVSDTSTVSILAQQSRSPGSVATGGVALRYLSAGVTTVQSLIPGMRQANGAVQTVTVTSPIINPVGTINLGAGLQRGHSFTLSAPAPAGGLAVTLGVTRTGVMQLSPNVSTPGSDTIVVNVPQGQTFGNFHIQGVEGVIADTVQFTATAPGFASASGTVRIWQPVFDLIFLNASGTTLTADDPFQARIGTPSSPTGGISIEDALRAGSPGLVVSFTTNAPTVAQLVTTAGPGDSVTALIPAQQSRTPGTVATGGVALDYLTTGSTVVSGIIPGYRTLPSSQVTVTVVAPALTVSNATVGAGLQTSTSVSLSAPVPAGGMDVVVRSANPGIVLISPNASTAGADSIVVTLNAGVSNFSFFVHGMENQVGAVGITVTAPGFTDGTATITVVTPAVDVIFLAASGQAGVTADDPFNARIGIPNAGQTSMSVEMNARAGGPGLTVTFTSSDATAGPLVTTALTGSPVTATIAAGAARTPGAVATGGVALRFAAAGTTTVVAGIPGFVSVPPAGVVVTINP